MSNKSTFALTAEDRTASAFASVEKNLQGVTSAFSSTTKAVAGFVGIAGMGAIIHNAIEAGAQVDYFTKQLDMSAEALTRWQYAANTVGINGEKMADIFKDVADKIGDAYINKGGAAKEALDNLGLSVADLVNLSPDQQLLAIARGLDNVASNAVKVQILESLAGDASRLLPLLKDNAEQLQILAGKSDVLGATMSKADAEALKRFDQSMKDIGASVQIVGQIIAVEFADNVRWLADVLQEDLLPIARKVGDVFKLITASVLGTGGILKGIFTLDMAEAEKAAKHMFDTFDTLFQDQVSSANGGKGLVIEITEGQLDYGAFDFNGGNPNQHIIDFYEERLRIVNENEHNIRETIGLYNRLVAEDERQAYHSRMQSTASLLGSLSQLVDGNSKRQFEMSKNLARAETIISTYSAAQKAYESMSKFGPITAGLAAAAAVGAGLARLNQINRTQFNSGSVSGGAGGGSVGTHPVVAGTGFPVDPNQQTAPAPATNHITIQIGDRTLAELVVKGNQIADKNNMQIFQTEDGFQRVRVY